MVSLKSSILLDQTLTKLFLSPDVTLLGYCFHSDLSQLLKRLPSLSFYRQISNFLDLSTLYTQVMAPATLVTSLSKVCTALF